MRRRIVDATYLSVVVPSMRPPPYDVADGVACIPPNGLPKQAVRDQYVIVGAGKTSMDTCLWLMRHGIAPERLTWIKPRDSWLLDRAAVQPGMQFARRVLADFSAQSRAIGRRHRSTTCTAGSSRWAACCASTRPWSRPCTGARSSRGANSNS